jgi:catechol 2,3-dioxygenase
MSEQQPRTASASIDPATEVGHLALTVADLERSVRFYTQAIGLREVSHGGGSVALGVAKKPLLILNEQPGAKPWPRGGRSYTGLYHFAILVPSRVDLGRWLSHWFRHDMPMPGQGDHLVSEALYLEDPDRHGIEVYRDRPRDEWQWDNGRVRMASDPVDIRGLLEEAEQSAVSWDGMPDGTKLGHIHLQVIACNSIGGSFSDIVNDFTGPDQCFARNAPGPGAVASQFILFNHHGFSPETGRNSRAG